MSDYTPDSLMEMIDAIRRGEPMGLTNIYRQLRAHADAIERIAYLEKRLELFADGKRVPESCDGIACMDETIRMQDEVIAKLKKHAEAMAKFIERLDREAVVCLPDCVDAYRADFKEET